MNTLLKRSRGFFVRAALAAAVMAGLLAFGGAPRAMADDCQRRIAKADHKLHEAIEHHGWNSEQAEHWRHELREERERCWNRYHRWWDEDGHRWHNERDWDDHDHDHR
jgi:dienelactone hydrolase